jgi:hypothetical protein
MQEEEFSRQKRRGDRNKKVSESNACEGGEEKVKR